MKKNKYIGIMMLTAGLVLAAASCTDYSDYNTAPTDGTEPIANNTLWENIASDQQLTKFADLAKKCNYSATLNSPRFFTVWAPVNEAISDADYNRLMASDSATIVKQFMQQHITEYNYPVSAALDSMTIVSLNDKHHPFTQKGFDGFSYQTVNIPSTNGVMHKINGLSEYYHNLYENIDNLEDCDSIKEYIQHYDEYYLDVNASVIGPLRDGKQTYLDSVLKKRNTVINSIMRADLGNEDSTYCMVIPNNKAWKDAYEAVYPCYNYIKKMDYLDLTQKTNVASNYATRPTDAKSQTPVEFDDETFAIIQDSLTCRKIVGNLVFSNGHPRNYPLFGMGTFAPTDSAITTRGDYLTDMQEIVDHTVSVNEMSNGMTRVVDSLTFHPWETYLKPIVVSVPAHTMAINKLTYHSIPLEYLEGRDTLFSKVPEMFRQWLFPAKSKFFSYAGVDATDMTSTNGKPEFGYILRDVCSATYHIYVVVVPEQVYDETAAVKPYYLRFYLNWTDASNKQQCTVLPQGARTNSKITTANAANTATVTNLGDPGRVNVIDLGEFTFPASYYGQSAYPSLMMMHTESYSTSTNRNRYDQQMRVAGVFLIPKAYNDKWVNSENE